MTSIALEPPVAARPSLALLGSEPWRALHEYAQHKLSPQTPAALGDGHPVVVFPGLASDARAVAPLRDHCRALGYNAFDWGRGFNCGPSGDVDVWLRELAGELDQMLAEHTQSVTLIGWSLGGIYAREAAKLLRHRVRQVITIGTPFNARSDRSHVGWLFRLLSGQPAIIAPELSRRLRTAPDVPTTSIYSRSDGIVAWQTCCHDRPDGQVEDVEIDGSHCGMGWNPQVLDVVGDRLAQRPGAWRPYEVKVG